MKSIISVLILFLFLSGNAQGTINQKDIRIDLFTTEKKSKNIVIGAIVEVLSGNKRIETSFSDFDGICIFYLNPSKIIKNKIVLKIYGPKCRTFKKEFLISSDSKIKIDLSYGKTKYQSYKDLDMMLSKLNIEPKPEIE